LTHTDILSGTGLGSELVKTAYDKYVLFALRSFPMFRSLADKRVVDQSMPGDSIVFNLYTDLATATSTLTETTDPTPTQVPATDQVTVTLGEYGANTLTTRKLRLFTLTDIDPAIANIVAYQMVNSLDEVVRTVISGGTNVTREIAGSMVFNTGATNQVTSEDIFTSRDVRSAVTKLRGRNVMPTNGASYTCLIHPDVSYDLRSEAGSSATWRPPHENSGPGPIWAGHIGEYEGANFVESPRTLVGANGASSATVHRTIFVGQQCLAEAVAQEPGVIFGPITDTLNRFRPIGWYGVLGWARYREEAIQRVETSSTL
jgi:N4-gp56 family major capsid protein